jgi:hypothetical protein
MGPEPLKISAQRFKARRIHRVHTASSFRAVGDKTGVLEHAQVLGNGGAADWEVASQLAHGAWTFDEALEDGATSAVAQGVPRRNSVSYH